MSNLKIDKEIDTLEKRWKALSYICHCRSEYLCKACSEQIKIRKFINILKEE